MNRTPFNSIAVFAIVGDLGERQLIESIGVQHIRELTESSAARAIDILPPTRQFTADEAFSELERASVDGVLFVILTDAYVDTYEAPGRSTTTGFASIYGSAYGRTVQYQERTTHTSGVRYSKPRETHELKLADMRTGSLVWISSSFTRGNAYADAGVMADSMLKVAIGELIAESLVVARPKAK